MSQSERCCYLGLKCEINVAVKNLKIKVFILVGITVDKLSRKILVCVPIDEKQES